MIQKPVSISAGLLLTAVSPISHHDPAVQDGSNVLTFNRQKQIVSLSGETGSIAPETISAFCVAFPVPSTLVEVLSGLTFPEFAATALVRLLIDAYNSSDGTGVFSGMNRYEKLESRLRTAGVRASNLRLLWSIVTRDLVLPIHPGKLDAQLVMFFSLPKPVQAAVVSAITEQYRSIVTIARVWSQQRKAENRDYADKMQMALVEDETVMAFEAGAQAFKPAMILDVPSVSANSVRHQLVREPGMAASCSRRWASHSQPWMAPFRSRPRRSLPMGETSGPG